MLCMISRPAKKRMTQKQLNILRSLQVTKRIHRCCHGKSILPHPLGKPEDGPGREEGSATVEAALVIPVFFASLCSLIMFGYAIVTKIAGKSTSGWSSLMASIWMLGGIQLLGLGIVGEYIGKIYNETKRRPRFIVETFLED